MSKLIWISFSPFSDDLKWSLHNPESGYLWESGLESCYVEYKPFALIELN